LVTEVVWAGAVAVLVSVTVLLCGGCVTVVVSFAVVVFCGCAVVVLFVVVSFAGWVLVPSLPSACDAAVEAACRAC